MSDLVNILIVDDEKVNLRLLEAILKADDVDVVSVESGYEALEEVRKKDFALIFMDVMMPDMDGFTAAEYIRSDEKTRDIPIIFVTAISKEDCHVFKGYELGAVDYLFKPVQPEILRSKARVFVQLHRQRQEIERSRRKLQESEERYRTVADYTYDWESWLSPSGELLYTSPSCERMTGYPPEKFVENPEFIKQIIHGEDLPFWERFMAQEPDSGDNYLDFRIIRSDGRVCWIGQANSRAISSTGEDLGLRMGMRDITRRKFMEIQFKQQALQDPLTGTGNRTLCLDRISLVIEKVKRHEDRCYAVIFMDLDRFKVVNDSLGHASGDGLLVEVSDKLLKLVRGVDTVARFGGDEFVILLEELDSRKEAIRVVKRIRNAMRETFQVGSHEIQTTASIGITFCTRDYEKPEELLQDANLAMYRAKESGRDRFRVFNMKMREKAVRRLTLESDLRRALVRKEFKVAFQPIVRLKDMRLIGFEALVRWQHPERGAILPGEFIPVAEDTGLIVPLGQWVFEKSCETMAAWREKIPQAGDLILSVNISGIQFSRNGFVDDLLASLGKTNLPPENVKLEITETTVMRDARSYIRRLNRIKESGIKLAIDDFGTGYSSMDYLQKFPLDYLKVDLSFVRGIDTTPENLEIVRAIITLAHNLGLVVISEGIENQAQKEILIDLGSDYGQGYLFSRPLFEAEAEKFIEAQPVTG